MQIKTKDTCGFLTETSILEKDTDTAPTNVFDNLQKQEKTFNNREFNHCVTCKNCRCESEITDARVKLHMRYLWFGNYICNVELALDLRLDLRLSPLDDHPHIMFILDDLVRATQWHGRLLHNRVYNHCDTLYVATDYVTLTSRVTLLVLGHERRCGFVDRVGYTRLRHAHSCPCRTFHPSRRGAGPIQLAWSSDLQRSTSSPPFSS